MASYFSACDVTVANSNHKNVLVFLTCTCAPTTLKIVPLPMRRLPIKQMFRTWVKTLLHCGYKYLLNWLVTFVVTYKKYG